MNGRNNTARILIVLGAAVLIAAALLHLSAYRNDLGAVGASNLIAVLKGGVRSLYFENGWDYIVIAIIMLISAFKGPAFKVIVLFCGLSLFVNVAVILVFMGWFVDTGMVLASALLSLCGGLLFQNTA